MDNSDRGYMAFNFVVLILIVGFIAIEITYMREDIKNINPDYSLLRYNQYECGDDVVLQEARGNSMVPHRSDGFLYYAEPVDGDDIVIGDMATYWRNGTLVNHYVENAYEDYIITIGLKEGNQQFVNRSDIIRRDCFKIWD